MALVCGVVPLVSSGTRQRAEDTKPATRVASREAADLASRVWKSETTGKEYRVKVDKDRFTAEWVNIPAAQARRGAFIRSEATPSGSKWVGVSRNYLPFAQGEGSGAKQGDLHWCRFATRIQIDSVTPSRISGHGETLKDFDLQTCKVLQTGWAEFVWVPKK